MSTADPPRLDKWLWCVRLYKTRGLATDACRLKRVTMAGNEVKPSREIKIGDIYEIQQDDLKKTVRVASLLRQRVGPKLVSLHLEDLTPPELYTAAAERRQDRSLAPQVAPMFRPNKKERRLIKELFEPKESGESGESGNEDDREG
jgi:ribosome-associated heat shock protein Hsp15